MIKKYRFFDGGEIEFESTRTVKELIEAAFEAFDYYEPLGMDLVTVFQMHHSKSSEGWFTTDLSRTCEEEIENCDELCFAYHKPNVFYYAEGGWGHHMKSLGNHPYIENAVFLKLRFEDFDNTVVINGNYTFDELVRYLQRGEYLSDQVRQIVVRSVNPVQPAYTIPLTDPIVKENLTEFVKALPQTSVVVLDIV